MRLHAACTRHVLSSMRLDQHDAERDKAPLEQRAHHRQLRALHVHRHKVEPPHAQRRQRGPQPRARHRNRRPVGLASRGARPSRSAEVDHACARASCAHATVHLHSCTFSCTFSCDCAPACMHVHVCTCICTCTCTCMCMCTSMCMHMNMIWMHLHVHVHAHVHVHVHVPCACRAKAAFALARRCVEVERRGAVASQPLEEGGVRLDQHPLPVCEWI